MYCTILKLLSWNLVHLRKLTVWVHYLSASNVHHVNCYSQSSSAYHNQAGHETSMKLKFPWNITIHLERGFFHSELIWPSSWLTLQLVYLIYVCVLMFPLFLSFLSLPMPLPLCKDATVVACNTHGGREPGNYDFWLQGTASGHEGRSWKRVAYYKACIPLWSPCGKVKAPYWVVWE